MCPNSTPSYSSQINGITRSTYFNLHNINLLCPSLTPQTTAILVHTLFYLDSHKIHPKTTTCSSYNCKDSIHSAHNTHLAATLLSPNHPQYPIQILLLTLKAIHNHVFLISTSPHHLTPSDPPSPSNSLVTCSAQHHIH